MQRRACSSHRWYTGHADFWGWRHQRYQYHSPSRFGRELSADRFWTHGCRRKVHSLSNRGGRTSLAGTRGSCFYAGIGWSLDQVSQRVPLSSVNSAQAELDGRFKICRLVGATETTELEVDPSSLCVKSQRLAQAIATTTGAGSERLVLYRPAGTGWMSSPDQS